VNVQVNSCTGPLAQSNAPAEICIVFWPNTTGEGLKVNVIVVSPLNKITPLAGVPFTMKSRP
jgi:hypothetical protein